MAGSSSSSDDGIISGINVTPLVDVMLCLLVIFMVTTSYVVADSIKMDLPEASTGGSTEPTTLMIAYSVNAETNERQLRLNGEEKTEEDIRAFIKALSPEKKKDVQAVIAADKVASHGEVIHLIDLVKQEGVLKFALNIQSPAK